MASSQIIILAIVATSAATYISRFMGVITSESEHKIENFQMV